MRITRHHNSVLISASARDTYEWANRPGNRWPCSTIADKRLHIELHDGDLVDLWVNGRNDVDVDGHELTAFIDDLIGD